MNISIRPFRESDRSVLRQIFLECRRIAFHWCDPETFTLADFDERTRDETINVAVEFMSDKPVGFISVFEPENFIHHLFVSPAHARAGIGRALIQSLPKLRSHPHRLKCLAKNLPAIAFYKALGFHEVGSGIAPEGPYLTLEAFPIAAQRG